MYLVKAGFSQENLSALRNMEVPVARHVKDDFPIIAMDASIRDKAMDKLQSRRQLSKYEIDEIARKLLTAENLIK